jgi:hypothetical protein
MPLRVTVSVDTHVDATRRHDPVQTTIANDGNPYAASFERCVLDAQRLHARLDGIVHQLSVAGGTPTDGPAGAIALLRESNRRMELELDEFAFDAQAILSMLKLAERRRGRIGTERRGA